MVNAEPNESWVVWGELNDECDALEAGIEGAIQVAGKDSTEVKEQRLQDFAMRLQAQGLTLDQWLENSGQDQAEFVETLRTTAAQAARFDLGLRAVAAAEDAPIELAPVLAKAQVAATPRGLATASTTKPATAARPSAG